METLNPSSVRFYQQECRICTDRGFKVTIPKGAGLPNVDTLLYIEKGKDSVCNVTIAAQELCAQEHTEDRPVAAFISICPNLFKYPRRFQTDVMVHEVCHALGVSIYVYPYLRKEDGTPQTPRDPETNLPNLGMFGKDLYYSGHPLFCNFYFSNYTSITRNESRLTASGHVTETIYHFTLPNVVGEIMAMSVGKPLHISHFLLAFLYDTGWYHVSDAHTAAPTWGKSAGEEFLTKSCYEYVKLKRSKNQPPTPFCGWEEVNVPACLPDRSGYGLCEIVRMKPTVPSVHTVDPPETNVHYRSHKFGGPRIQFNYCPVIEVS
ncbi:Leishmanolysin-like peptidase [Clonorchis sinensis]|uniref:Leishmanolysin-like peptidase n=1 Tax=Clonorchis sinensis TaxID=79923 RepID=A0A419PKF0_CLOSI|nr:Leishmanolysin-like peptidase [Clonorchis sinensis]